MKHAMTTGDSQNQRHLPIEATHNFRDVGGYPAAGGRVMKWRTLFRSDSLHRLSPASQREVVNLGVRSIIDLRFEQEVRDWPSPFAAPGGLDYRHLPVSLDFIADASVRNIEELYHWMLEECQGRISKILSAMAVSGTFPAVVHCAGGKDRTGILVALLLELAGVARETVVEDYTLTGPIRRRTGAGDDGERETGGPRYGGVRRFHGVHSSGDGIGPRPPGPAVWRRRGLRPGHRSGPGRHRYAAGRAH